MMLMRDDDSRLPFFVYGTLRPGEINHSWLLRGRTKSETPAVLHGALLLEGPGYPYAVADERGRVHGDVIHPVEDLYQEVLADLDRLEEYSPGAPGNLYERVVRDVRTYSGQTLRAWVYLAAADHERELREKARPIAGGDWKRR